MIFLRHYFPSVDIESLEDEDFARLSEEAIWLHQQMVITQQTNALGMLA